MPEKTRLVGREAEVGDLDAEWQRAAGGELRCVLLAGRAGGRHQQPRPGRVGHVLIREGATDAGDRGRSASRREDPADRSNHGGERHPEAGVAQGGVRLPIDVRVDPSAWFVIGLTEDVPP